MIRTTFLAVAVAISVSAALAAADGVRLTAAAGVVQMRIEVVSASGATLYDSEWKSGNVLDSTMPVLPYGSYGLRISTRDLEGRLFEKQTTLHVAPDGMSIDPAAASDLKMTTTFHNGETGQLVTTSGDLSFRFGDYLNRKDTEAMRLTPEGNLDVKGWIRPGQGIVFADGSTVTSAGSIMRTRASRSEPASTASEKKLAPGSNLGGTGAQNQVAKWIDNLGNLGNSSINDVNGSVRIGTVASQGQLQIAGAGTQDVFAGMGPDLVNGPAFNFGYAGQSFGIGAGFFNVRPAAGATGVNPSLRFMTANQERMIITNSGNIGIGTSNPLRAIQIGPDTDAAFTIEPSDASPNAGYIRFGDQTGWMLHIGRSRESSAGTLNTGTTGVLMTVQDDGNVAIGTPGGATARLVVISGNTQTTSSGMQVSASGDGVYAYSSVGASLIVDGSSALRNLEEGRRYGVPVFHINPYGTYVTGSDFAEAMPGRGETKDYEPGDVLVVSTEASTSVEKAARPNDPRVAGVYSTRPGMLGAEKNGTSRVDPDDLPVAIVGIVPTKVSAENGVIRVGDLLTTSSTPGYAMKASPVILSGIEIYRPGTILGKALEPLKSNKGVIKVLITLR